MANRVVITSVGIVSSLGFSTGEIVRSLEDGGAVMVPTGFEGDVWAFPIEREFDVRRFTGRCRNARYLNRGARLCVAAAMAAVKGAEPAGHMWGRAGLFVGAGPNLDIGNEFPEIRSGAIDSKSLAALWILKFLPNTAASVIADLAGIHGENATIGTACAASLQAIGEAFRKIRHGNLDLALAGGGDSRLSPGGILAYRKARALRTGGPGRSGEYSPFSATRAGFVPGEGGAFVVLENLEHARSRGARIIAEIRGYGASMDGCGMTAPDPSGRWAEAAVRSALNESGMASARVDVVCAHGTGTVLNDAMEADLIARVFGEHRPMVTALKSRIGHLAAACGAVELSIGLACMEHGYVPEIRHLEEPCRAGIDFVLAPRSAPVSTMLIQNFGFGGQNSALVVNKWEN